MRADHRNLNRRGLTGPMLLTAVFCAVSGGPYGLEPVVKEAGPGLALILIVAIPILWALPDALTTAELASSIPREGGYVVWVKRALGPFAAFVNGWWTWMYTLVDVVIYPVLFVSYFNALLETAYAITMPDPTRYAVGAGVVAFITFLNVRGTRLVGVASMVFTIGLFVPFVIMTAYGLVRLGGDPQPIVRAMLPEGTGFWGALSSSLAVILWNYLGWDILSTVAEEVENPEKAYPFAMLAGVPLVTLIYLGPTLVGLAHFPEIALWEEGAWPLIARAVAGDALMWMVFVAGLLSPLALYSSSLLGGSRLPFVLAEDGYLPAWLVRVHPRWGTPYRAVLVCSAVTLMLLPLGFMELVGMSVVLYASALVMEAASLIVLRFKEPDLPRPFRIPGGLPVLIPLALLPLAFALFLIAADTRELWEDPTPYGRVALGLTLAAIISGPLLYRVLKPKRDS